MLTDPSLPPQNIEAEESILGGILLDPKAIARVIDILVPDAFYVRSHQAIYRSAIDLHEKQQPTDLMTVSSHLQDRKLLDEIGGIPRLLQLVDRTVSAANVDRYAELVMDKFTRRKLISAAGEIIELARDYSIDLSEILEQAEGKIRTVGEARAIDGAIPISDVAVEVYQEIEKIQESGIVPGIPTGFYDLDEMTGGFHRGDLIIVAGRPAMGKTSLVAQMATNIARAGHPALIFSLEMSRGQLYKRLLSERSGLPGRELTGGKLTDSDIGKILVATEDLASLPIAIDDRGSISVSHIRSTARAFRERYKSIGFVAIDYLQLMGGESDNRNYELGKITRSLKMLAKELDCPIVFLSQLNRGVENRSDKRPVMSDLRDSGAIEADADLIAMLYRDEYYNPESHDKGLAEVIIAKHRNGPTGTVKLIYSAEFTKFLNLKRRGE